MKHGYAVKRNGVLYPAGTEVPEDKQFEENFNNEAPKNDEQREYKKSDIQKMNVDDLKALAEKLEIEGAQDKTGGVLKEEIISKLGL